MSAARRIADRFIIADPEQDLLACGGMGDVYRAIDTQTGETVAVKALNPDVLARYSGLLERFLREGEALRRYPDCSPPGVNPPAMERRRINPARRGWQPGWTGAAG